MEDRAGTPGTDRYLLVGDVGGTKTSLAVYQFCSEADQPRHEKTYASQDHVDLESIVESFLSEVEGPVIRASLAVAGPILGSHVRVTNLPWEVDGPRIAHRFGFDRTVLTNDLEAIARSIPHLSPFDLLTLHPGERDPRGPIVVIAPGTGLGEAYLTWNGEGYDAHSSEGGHADFAPTDDLQSELLMFLRQEFGHVSVERVGSGTGIQNVYRFLRDHRGMEEPIELAEQLARNDDPIPVIVSAAVHSKCALCEETLRTFVSIVGAEAGNLALKLLATGGIYLGGGLPPRVLPFLREERFLAAVHAKGRSERLLKRIPVHVILNPRAPLLGALQRGLQGLAT